MILNRFTLLTNQYLYKTTVLNQNIVTAARPGVLDPSLLTSQKLVETLREVSRKLKKTLKIGYTIGHDSFGNIRIPE